MSHICFFLSILITIFLLQISNLHSIAVHSGTNNHILQDNDDNQHIQNNLFYLIKNILEETNADEQLILLNQLREYLNFMCTTGYLGSSHAYACQRVNDIIHQHHDSSNIEQRSIQKRFFCNGFIGCKSTSG
ncbi:unnamed protein product [Adineta steineri]|uniref:Secreted protein n=1 Tax=Adineta steineri TaxID=433720 RepID=A0A818XTL0_9BILA|nr:unnamed protein product [Adineta steineri]